MAVLDQKAIISGILTYRFYENCRAQAEQRPSTKQTTETT
jgi:hypothetical protein